MRVRKAVFPVAGFGTRFLPATKSVPKEMLPVVDKPVIQYAVEEARAAGIEKCIFVTSRDKAALEDHFDRSPELEDALLCRGKLKIHREVEALVRESGTVVSVRQNEPLGMGHAVWCAREIVGNEPFAVILPDDLLHPRTADGRSVEPVLKQMVTRFARVQSSMAAVMEVAQDQTGKYGILDPAGEADADGLVPVRGLVEKPPPSEAPSRLAIIGRYILTPEIFNLLARHRRGTGGEIQLTDAMAALMGTQKLYGYRFEGTRYDCGDKSGFQMGNMALALEREEFRPRLLAFMEEQLAFWKRQLQPPPPSGGSGS
ncbi:MAG: UTP--glucose-1-phosphate uridylyltransferase GalU [Magnetococcales bacterium]|nr:UTP--glucose-1-phosphate uridylyltransferase GalU [Magnetococcales bacterium]